MIFNLILIQMKFSVKEEDIIVKHECETDPRYGCEPENRKISDHMTWTADTAKSSGRNLVFGTKPVQILIPYIKILSPRDGIVMDPFGGAGSTLIASEIMQRQCRVMEIEPLYAEVILNRYERFTGKSAVKL